MSISLSICNYPADAYEWQVDGEYIEARATANVTSKKLAIFQSWLCPYDNLYNFTITVFSRRGEVLFSSPEISSFPYPGPLLLYDVGNSQWVAILGGGTYEFEPGSGMVGSLVAIVPWIVVMMCLGILGLLATKGTKDE